jgi:GntR family transcriptional regulator
VMFALVSGAIQMTSVSLNDRRDRIDRRKPEHLWSQVAGDIRADIDAGRLVSGDKLPGELELAEQYGVARLTVRHAVADLADAGYVVVLRGRGTFVAERA